MLCALVFAVLFLALQQVFNRAVTLVLYPFLFAAMASLIVRRLHDQARSAWWLLTVLVPVLGPLLLATLLLFRRGTTDENRYGDDPRLAGRDYLQVAIHEPV